MLLPLHPATRNSRAIVQCRRDRPWQRSLTILPPLVHIQTSRAIARQRLNLAFPGAGRDGTPQSTPPTTLRAMGCPGASHRPVSGTLRAGDWRPSHRIQKGGSGDNRASLRQGIRASCEATLARSDRIQSREFELRLCPAIQAAEKLVARLACRRLKPTQTENKRLERWPEGQHYPICVASSFSAACEADSEKEISGLDAGRKASSTRKPRFSMFFSAACIVAGWWLIAAHNEKAGTRPARDMGNTRTTSWVRSSLWRPWPRGTSPRPWQEF